jgi:hypothetical protein
MVATVRGSNNTLSQSSGVSRLPRESQGCSGTHEEPNGDEQDSEACPSWNCPDEIDLNGKKQLNGPNSLFLFFFELFHQ